MSDALGSEQQVLQILGVSKEDSDELEVSGLGRGHSQGPPAGTVPGKSRQDQCLLVPLPGLDVQALGAAEAGYLGVGRQLLGQVRGTVAGRLAGPSAFMRASG